MNTIERNVAQTLLQIKAIKLSPANYFTWASGWHSPIYCDNRKILSFPEARKLVYESFAEVIAEKYPEVEVKPGAKVVVIEDLVSTGGSSLAAVEALRKAGCEVLGMVAIFTYGFPVAVENFEKAGVKLDTLSNYGAMIALAAEEGYVKEEELETLQEWRKNPSQWRQNE